MNTSRRLFTSDEDYLIQKIYPDTPTRVIAFILNRHSGSIVHRAGMLKIEKNPDYLIEITKHLGNGLKKSGAAHRFKKGFEPKNKGLKQTDYMTPEAIEKTISTRFKSGQKVHNEGADGDIRIRHPHKKRGGKPYKFIRISKGKWLHLHVYNWIQENGPVPKGFIVAFKNADTMNCDISNLEVLTRAENMKRNAIHNYPEEIKTTLRLISKVKRKIKKYEEQN